MITAVPDSSINAISMLQKTVKIYVYKKQKPTRSLITKLWEPLNGL